MHDDQKTKAQLINELEALRSMVNPNDVTEPSSCELERDRYRQMVDGLPQMVYEFNLEMQLVFANNFGLLTFGLTQKDIDNGITLDNFIHPDDIERAKSNVSRTLRGGEPVENEYLAVHKDGSTFPIRVYSQAVFIDGKPIGVRGTVLNLSKLKRAERALKESANHYHTLFEHTGTAMAIFGDDAIITDVNSQFCMLSGYTKEEVENTMSWMDFIRPEKIEPVGGHDTVDPLGAGKTLRTYQCPFVTSDGIEKHVQIFIQLVPGTNSRICSLIDVTEAVKAEQALRESENYYRTLFGNTGTAMVIYDKDTVIRSCNAQYEALVGFSKEEIVEKMNWQDFIAPEDQERVLEYHRRRTAGDPDIPRDYEFSLLGHNKERKYIHVYVEMIPGTTDRVCSMLDITDRKRTEQALRTSEERYELVVRGANDGIWDWDLETNAVYYSPRYKEIIGFTDEEFPNSAESWLNQVHPDDTEHTIAANRECIDGSGDLFEVEYRMLHKDGTYRWIHGRGAGVMDDNGKIYRLAGTHTDITERKLHEQTNSALYAISRAISTTEDLHHLFQNIHTILGEVIDTTNFFISLYSPEEQRVYLTYVQDTLDDYGEYLDISDPNLTSPTVEIIHTGKSLFLSSADPKSSAEWDRIGMQGTRPESWVGVPLKVKGNIIGTMTVQHYTDPHRYSEKDVSLMETVSEQVALAIERKANEEELTRLNEELESKVAQRTAELENKATELETANKRLTELDKIKSALVSSISHELRTPLTSIRGFAKLTGKDFQRHFQPLAQTPTQEKKGKRITKNMGIIESEGIRLTRLINDFLDINKIESGKAVWNDAFLNPCDIVRHAVNALSGAFAAKPEVALITSLPELVPPIHADPDKIQQVIINLLNNACKFTSKGNVTVSLTADIDSLTIVVSDTGVGIPKAEQAQIFEKFHKSRSGDTIKAKDKGTGLGLAISREIVQHYGGSIWVDSTEGQGSEFSFSLPAIPGSLTACT